MEVVRIAQVDNRVAGFDDRLDGVNRIAQVARFAGVDGVAKVDDELDWVDEVIRIADRVDIYRVINLSLQNTLVAKWQIAKVKSEIWCFKCWFQDY